MFFGRKLKKSAGKRCRSRLVGFPEYDAAHGLRRYFGPVGRAEEEIPEAENEKQLARDYRGYLDEKARAASSGVIFFCHV